MELVLQKFCSKSEPETEDRPSLPFVAFALFLSCCGGVNPGRGATMQFFHLRNFFANQPASSLSFSSFLQFLAEGQMMDHHSFSVK